MWNDYVEVDGIIVGCTDAAYPFMHRKEEWAKDFKRPQIALTRATIHEMANSSMSREDIINWLYKCVKISEQTHTAIYKRERRNSDMYSAIPYKNKSGFVYFMWCQEKQIMKIGCSGEPHKRKSALQREVGSILEIIGTIETGRMYELEREMHELFSCRRHDGEWFKITPIQLKVADRYLKRKGDIAA